MATYELIDADLWIELWWLMIVLPFIGAILTPIVAKIYGRLREILGIVSIGASASLAGVLIADVPDETHEIAIIPWNSLSVSNTALMNAISTDELSVFMALIAAGLGFLIAVFSVEYMGGDEALTRYWFFIQFFVGSMLLLVMAGDLIFLYAGWEGVGLCSYGLIAHWMHKPDPQGEMCTKSGVKAFVFTRIGDIGLLMGIVMLFFYTGEIQFGEIGAKFAAETAQIPLHADFDKELKVLVGLLIFAGAIGKSAQFPLHTWLSSPDSVDVDAMQGPTTVSALIHAATMVKAGVYLVSRFYLSVWSHEQVVNMEDVYVVIGIIGAITALWTALCALVTLDIKRVLAYSTISQLAYMFMGVAIAGLFFSADHGELAGTAFLAAQAHLLSHALFKCTLFLSAGAIIHSVNTRNIKEMGGLRKDMPVLFAATLIGAIALSGIPFLNFSKDYIIESAYELAIEEGSNQPVAWLLFIVAAITALLTSVYVFRMVFLVFFGEQTKGLEVHKPGIIMQAVVVILALGTIATAYSLFFLNDWFFPTEQEGANVHWGELHLIAEGDALIGAGVAIICALLGIGIAFLLYGKGQREFSLARDNEYLNQVQSWLWNGLFLDQIYTLVTYKVVLPAFHRARRIHTGILNYNMAGVGVVFLATLAALILL